VIYDSDACKSCFVAFGIANCAGRSAVGHELYGMERSGLISPEWAFVYSPREGGAGPNRWYAGDDPIQKTIASLR